MGKSTPQMGPGGAVSASTGSESMPMATPPAAGAGSAGKEGCGCGGGTGVTSSAAAPPMMMMSGADESAPMLRPAALEGAASGGITAWQNNKRITGLWSINQNRNSWVHVDGVGWKKLANNSDSAIVAPTVLGAHAREKNSPVNYREEADGMIREMYVW